MEDPLLQLRNTLSDVDAEIVRHIAARQRIVQQIGALKRTEGRPLRDFAREKEVLLRVRTVALAEGFDPDVAESVLRTLIRASLEHQEQAQVFASGEGIGKRALVLGGAGKMGRWFAEFLHAQGFSVEIGDPAGANAGFPWRPSWAEPDGSAPQHDVIVVSAPIAQTARILHELAEVRPTGLIFDVGSIKSPLRSGLLALATAGCRVTSIHPMFGPDTTLLSGRHVLCCPVDGAQSLEAAKSLFHSTTAELIEVPLDQHDPLIAYVLGLSHALNIAFFTALARSGEAAPVLARLSSTTFDAQMDIASRVANENPALYFEIQHLNESGQSALNALEEAVGLVVEAVRAGDEDTFSTLMLDGRAYLSTRRGDPVP